MAVRVLHLGAFIDEGYFTIHNVHVITPLCNPLPFMVLLIQRECITLSQSMLML